MDLTAEEVRVLGCLMEKQVTTPEYYPLTLNALRQASNQTSSRNPVVSLDDRTVEAALTTLREKGLVRIVHSVHNRATKYRHVADEQLPEGGPRGGRLKSQDHPGEQSGGQDDGSGTYSQVVKLVYPEPPLEGAATPPPEGVPDKKAESSDVL